MLDRPRAARKDSLRHPSNCGRPRRLGPQQIELPVGALVEQGLGRLGRQFRVLQKGLPDAPPPAPPGVCGDDPERLRSRPKTGRRLHDVRLRGKPVFEESRDDPGVGIPTQDEQSPPTDDPGEIDPFRDRQVRQASSQVHVGGTPEFGVDPGVRGKVRQITPEEGLHERECFTPRGVPMPRERQPDGMEAARLGVPENRFELVGRQVLATKLREELSFDSHA